MFSCCSSAGIETPAPLLVSGIVNNALFHSSKHRKQTLHQISHILHFRLVADLCLRFYCQLDWGQGCSAAINLEFHRCDHDLLRQLHFWSGEQQTKNLGFRSYGQECSVLFFLTHAVYRPMQINNTIILQIIPVILLFCKYKEQRT